MSRLKPKKLQAKAAKMKTRRPIRRRRVHGRQIAKRIVARRKRMAAMSRRHRTQLMREVVGCYRSARYLRESEDEWLEFIRYDEWEGFRNRPKPGDQQNSIKFVIRLFVGFGGTPETKRASDYYRALQPMFAANVPSRKLPRLFRKAGGFKELIKSRKTDDAAEETVVGELGKSRDVNDEAEEGGDFEKLSKSRDDGGEADDGAAEEKPTRIRILSNQHSEKFTESSVDDRVVVTLRILSVSRSRVEAKIVRIHSGPT